MRRILSFMTALALVLCCFPMNTSAAASQGETPLVHSAEDSGPESDLLTSEKTDRQEPSGLSDGGPGDLSRDMPKVPGAHCEDALRSGSQKSGAQNLSDENEGNRDEDEDNDDEEDDEDDGDDGDDEENKPQKIFRIQIPAPAAPSVGAAVSAYGISCGAYSLYGAWHCNGTVVPVGSIFEAGSTYVLRISVSLHENYCFGAGLKAYVGGREAAIQWNGTTPAVQLSYTLPAAEPEAPQVTAIDNWTWGGGFSGFSTSLTGNFSFREVCAVLPGTIISEGSEIGISWICPGYAQKAGTYFFTGVLPAGYVLGEDATALSIAVEIRDEQTVTYTEVAKRFPTCDTDGMEAYFLGSDGNYYIETGNTKVPVSKESLVIARLGHLWSVDVEYLWQEDGSACTAKRVCLRDGTHAETSEATVTSRITREPTEEEMGQTTYTAVFPDVWAGSEAPVTLVLTNLAKKPHVHQPELIPGTPATEETTGLKAYYHCALCGKNFEDADCSLEIQDLDSWRVIPRQEHVHQLEHVEERKPTCLEQGVKEHWHCPSCGKNFADPEGREELSSVAVEPLAHSFSGTTYTWSADGRFCVAEHTCSLCGLTEKADGAVTSRLTRAPGCTGYGETTYTASFSVDWAQPVTKTLSDAAPLGHRWGEVTYTWSDGGESCTAQRECLRNPGHRETASAVIRVSENTPEPGKTTVTAVFSEPWAKSQTRVLETPVPEETEDAETETDIPEAPSREEAIAPDLPENMELTPGNDCFRVDVKGTGENSLIGEISLDALKDIRRGIAENGRASGLTFACGAMAVTYDLHALDAVLDQADGADGICLSVEPQLTDAQTLTQAQQEALKDRKNGTLYSVELSLLYGDRQRQIHDFDGGSAAITVPCGGSFLRTMKAYRVEEDGSLTELPCEYQPEDDSVTFVTPSHSHYMVVSTVNLFFLAWLAAGLMLCGMFVVMFKNRRGYLTED